MHKFVKTVKHIEGGRSVFACRKCSWRKETFQSGAASHAKTHGYQPSRIRERGGMTEDERKQRRRAHYHREMEVAVGQDHSAQPPPQPLGMTDTHPPHIQPISPADVLAVRQTASSLYQSALTGGLDQPSLFAEQAGATVAPFPPFDPAPPPAEWADTIASCANDVVTAIWMDQLLGSARRGRTAQMRRPAGIQVRKYSEYRLGAPEGLQLVTSDLVVTIETVPIWPTCAAAAAAAAVWPATAHPCPAPCAIEARCWGRVDWRALVARGALAILRLQCNVLPLDEAAILALLQQALDAAAVRMRLDRLVQAMRRRQVLPDDFPLVVIAWLGDLHEVPGKILDFLEATFSQIDQPLQALVALSATVRGLAGAQYRIENPGSATEVGPAGLTYVRSQDTGTILLPYWWVGSGTGSVSITGNMQPSTAEAVVVAFSTVRLWGAHIAARYQTALSHDPATSRYTSFNLHVPCGALQFSGRSAGLSVLVSLVRTLLCVRVPSNLGLTGEVSLSGELVSVLRLREKIEGAATNHAITNFVVPADNTAADQSSGAQQPPTVVARGLAVSDGQYVMIESPVEVEPSLARRVRVYAAATLLDCLDLALVLAPGRSVQEALPRPDLRGRLARARGFAAHGCQQAVGYWVEAAHHRSGTGFLDITCGGNGCVVVAVKAVVTWMFRFRRSIQHKYRIRLPLSFGAARLAFDPRKGEPWRFFISGMHCDLHFNFPGFTGADAACGLAVAAALLALQLQCEVPPGLLFYGEPLPDGSFSPVGVQHSGAEMDLARREGVHTVVMARAEHQRRAARGCNLRGLKVVLLDTLEDLLPLIFGQREGEGDYQSSGEDGEEDSEGSGEDEEGA